MSEALLVLADRCEREAPSRHLDDAIAIHAMGGWYRGWAQAAPRCFTSSLDAAVRLYPEGRMPAEIPSDPRKAAAAALRLQAEAIKEGHR